MSRATHDSLKAILEAALGYVGSDEDDASERLSEAVCGMGDQKPYARTVRRFAADEYAVILAAVAMVNGGEGTQEARSGVFWIVAEALIAKRARKAG